MTRFCVALIVFYFPLAFAGQWSARADKDLCDSALKVTQRCTSPTALKGPARWARRCLYSSLHQDIKELPVSYLEETKSGFEEIMIAHIPGTLSTWVSYVKAPWPMGDITEASWVLNGTITEEALGNMSENQFMALLSTQGSKISDHSSPLYKKNGSFLFREDDYEQGWYSHGGDHAIFAINVLRLSTLKLPSTKSPLCEYKF